MWKLQMRSSGEDMQPFHFGWEDNSHSQRSKNSNLIENKAECTRYRSFLAHFKHSGFCPTKFSFPAYFQSHLFIYKTKLIHCFQPLSTEQDLPGFSPTVAHDPLFSTNHRSETQNDMMQKVQIG